MRKTTATAPMDHLHAHDQARAKANLPAALNAQLMPASRLLPSAQTTSDDEFSQILKNGLKPGGLHELRCPHSRDVGALTGFVFALLCRMKQRQAKPVLWISAPFADTSNMTLFPQGLANMGFDPTRLIIVKPLSVKHALWAADEAAKCTDLAAIILHVEGHPKALDMTATRRLSLRASESGATALIMRQSSGEEATTAITRWCVTPHISCQTRVINGVRNSQDIGFTSFSSHLERNRQGATGNASLIWNHQIRGFQHAPTQDIHDTRPPTTLPQHRLSGVVNGSGQSPVMGQVVAFQTALEQAS